jgi:hypothetical protein
VERGGPSVEKVWEYSIEPSSAAVLKCGVVYE